MTLRPTIQNSQCSERAQFNSLGLYELILSFQDLTGQKYKVSWKADGTRYMMAILGKDQVYMIDRDNVVFKEFQI